MFRCFLAEGASYLMMFDRWRGIFTFIDYLLKCVSTSVNVCREEGVVYKAL